MVRELYTKGVRQQAQTEKKWLANLIANQRAIKTLFRFLQTTKIEGGERVKKRELEKKQKSDQASKNLLG